MPPPAPPIHRSQDESISASVCAKEKNNKSNVSAKEKNNFVKKENIECVKEKIESMKESDSMQKVRATTPQVKIKLSINHLLGIPLLFCSRALPMVHCPPVQHHHPLWEPKR